MEISQLPHEPSTPADFGRWKEWVQSCESLGQWPVLHQIAQDDRNVIAWRAILAHAAAKSIAPEEASPSAHHLLTHANQTRPHVFRAAELLVRRMMEDGTTSPDALFLIAAFAWPLRDMSLARSEEAWQYLIHAPWQTDAATLVQFCVAVSQVQHPDRRLLSLATARLEAGRRDCARELLEAMVLVHAGKERMEQLTAAEALAGKRKFPDVNEALLRLAQIYVEDGAVQLSARAVVESARDLPSSPPDLARAARDTVWDRPFEEIYAWAGRASRPADIESEINRLMAARQPGHARRAAEALLMRNHDRHIAGDPMANTRKALARFMELPANRMAEHHASRCAAEHLAILYVRTNHITEYARSFVRQVSVLPEFTGAGAHLHPIVHELQRFVNETDPYFVFYRSQESALANADPRRSDDERRAADAVNGWFSKRCAPPSGGIIEKMISVLTAPGRLLSKSLPIEDACAAAFRLMMRAGILMTGDMERLREDGAAIREQHGFGLRLMERAREVTRVDKLVAAAASAGLSLLPAGLSLLSRAADLGTVLLLTYRAVCRVGALYGIERNDARLLTFVQDSFALGCSSKDGEGLLAYLSRGRRQVVSAITVGGVAYGAQALAGHLWTAPGQSARMIADEGIRNVARLCGYSLSEQSLAKSVPIAGAVLSGIATLTFIQSILDAAIHLAARDSLLLTASTNSAR